MGRERSNPCRENGGSPSDRTNWSGQSGGDARHGHLNNNNKHARHIDNYSNHNDHYGRPHYQQDEQHFAPNEGIRRRVSPRSSTNEEGPTALPNFPSPGDNGDNRNKKFSSRGGGNNQGYRQSWVGSKTNDPQRPSSGTQHRQHAHREAMSESNQEDYAAHSTSSNAVLDAASPSNDLPSFPRRRISSANQSSTSAVSAPVGTLARGAPPKSALRTGNNAMHPGAIVHDESESRECPEIASSDSADEQNIVITGLHQLDIDETQRDLAIREARAVQAQSRMRQHLMEEMERTREILHRTEDQPTRASYERHLKGLQVELGKWNRSLEVAKSSSFSSHKVGAFVEEEAEEEVEELEEEVEEEVEEARPNNADQSLSPNTTIVTEPKKEISRTVESHSQIEMANIYPKTPFTGGMVNIIAPSTLPAGYKFEAKIGQKSFIATVPPGGVKKGETFATPIGEKADNDLSDDGPIQQQKSNVEMMVPNGRWRDELFDCLNDGCCHPMLCNSCFCPQVALTQIMTRMQITSRGERSATYKAQLTVGSVLGFTAALFLLNGMFVYIMIRQPQLPLLIICSVPTLLLDLSVLSYFYSILVKIRRNIREEYNIPETRCRGCEDATVSLCFTCCALAQIGRHTADYSTYRGTCCSDTGLPDHVEPNVFKENVKACASEQKMAPPKENYDEEFAYHEF